MAESAVSASATRSSIRVRVTAVVGAVVLAVLAFAAVLLLETVDGRLRASAEREAREGLETAEVQLVSGAPIGDVLTVRPGAPLISVADGAGVPVSPTPIPEVSLESFVVDSTGAATEVDVVVSGEVLVEEVDVGGVPIVQASRSFESSVGEFVVLSAVPVDQDRRTIATLRVAALVAVPLFALLVAGLAWLLVGRALRPVDRMRSEAESISHGTLHRRLTPPGSGDELDRLARTMNELLDRLDEGHRRQRQFVSDASHELRSPLATVRTMSEVGLRERGDDATLSGVLREAERMSVLVDDLLTMARLDEDPVLRDEIDLDDLVLHEAARLSDVGVASVDVRRVAPVRVEGDGVALCRLVRNLLDNAGRHARDVVRVTLRKADGVPELAVEDDGAGIDPADRERVFERFVRLDEGRSRDRGGAGIGLALVRSVARAHGGDVTVDASDLGGARFLVRLGAGTAR